MVYHIKEKENVKKDHLKHNIVAKKHGGGRIMIWFSLEQKKEAGKVG